MYIVQYNVTAEFNGLSSDKDHWTYGLCNLDTYCTKKKKIGSYLKNKYYRREALTQSRQLKD